MMLARQVQRRLAASPRITVILTRTDDRFLTLRVTAFADPKSYFHRYSKL